MKSSIPEPKRLVDEWRIDNLKLLLSEISNAPAEDNARIALATAINKATGKNAKESNDKLGRILSGSVSFGASWVDIIERAARILVSEGRLDEKWGKINVFDYPPEEPITVYMLAAVNIAAWGQILSALKIVTGFCEASLVYGDSEMDALIKIKASLNQIHRAILHISSLPHISRTQTLQSVPHSHMQVNQGEENADIERLVSLQTDNLLTHRYSHSLSIESKEDDCADVIEKRVKKTIYPSHKFQELFLTEVLRTHEDLSDIFNGKIKITSQIALTNLPEIIVDAARNEICAVVYWKELGPGESERHRIYLRAQTIKIKKKMGNFTIKRAFVIDDIGCWQNDHALINRISCELYSGINVRLIEENRVPKDREGDAPEDYGIMDDQAYWMVMNTQNERGMRIINLSLVKSDIVLALDKFKAIWAAARELDEDDKKKCEMVINNDSKAKETCW